MKLIIRDDVQYGESQRGAFAVMDDKRIILKGRGIVGWIARLAPYLEGDHTLADLVAGLAEEEARAVRSVVGYLGQVGIVEFVPVTPRRGDRILVSGQGRIHDAIADACRRLGARLVRAEPYDAAILLAGGEGSTVWIRRTERDVRAMDLGVRTGPLPPLSGTALTVVANQIMRIAAGGGERLVRFEASTLTATDHQVMGGPPRGGERMAALVDDWSGPVGEPEEVGAPQFPLSVTRTRVACPGAGYAVGYGLTREQSELSAIRKGLARFASYALDKRRVPGVAVSDDWDSAVKEGTLELARHVTLNELGTRRTVCPRVDLASAPLEAVGDHCREMLRASGRSVEVYDVTGRWGIPAYGCCVDGRTVAFGCSDSPMTALRAVLLDALLVVQTRGSVLGWPEFARLPAIPLELRSPRPERTPYRREVSLEGLPAVVEPVPIDPLLSRTAPRLVWVACRHV
ncbi:YcaO-like family protein [[Actinomadura] parvosata]|uniref:YcaO-like family protein n=1 Tax=[Actinomadura] parvosata TaxID=1955412 RepID=UPI00406C1373